VDIIGRVSFFVILLAKRNKKEKIDLPSAKEDPKFVWKPVLPAYSVPLEDSGASVAARSRSMGRARHQARMNFLLNPPSASIDWLLLCSQDVPSAISTALEAPGLKEPDPLQQEVDPKLRDARVLLDVVTIWRTCLLEKASGRVDVDNILCAWCELAESQAVDTQTLCAETLCVSTASTGDGAARKQKSSFCFADCQPLSTANSAQGQGVR
jgi:hypothetical protein